MKEETELQVVPYRKPNFMASAKYKASLTENRLLALCLERIASSEITKDAAGAIICTFQDKELKDAIGGKSNSFYERLKETSEQMAGGRTIGYVDDEKHVFQFSAVITDVRYENGTFTVIFNSTISKLLENISERYTSLNLITMLSFTSVYTFRLYEILKSQAYSPSWDKQKTEWIIDMSMAELQLELGVVNSEIDAVRSELHGANPDYEKAVAKSPEKVNTTWRNFRRAIQRAIDEINEKTELDVELLPVKSGRGQKVQRINFVVRKKQDKDNLPEEEKAVLYDEVFNLIEEKITYTDVKNICEAAGYDILKIKTAYKVYINYKKKKEVESIVAFMIDAIKKNWEPAVDKKETPGDKWGGMKTDYDFDAIEQALLRL